MKSMKKMNKKGFTLAELLIVVAIIAVLVAIAIPVFTAQLNKSKLATDTANVRSAYAEIVADALADGNAPTLVIGSLQAKLPADQVNAGTNISIASGAITVSNAAGTNTITIDSDVSVTAGNYNGSK